MEVKDTITTFKAERPDGCFPDAGIKTEDILKLDKVIENKKIQSITRERNIAINKIIKSAVNEENSKFAEALTDIVRNTISNLSIEDLIILINNKKRRNHEMD